MTAKRMLLDALTVSLYLPNQVTDEERAAIEANLLYPPAAAEFNKKVKAAVEDILGQFKGLPELAVKVER